MILRYDVSGAEDGKSVYYIMRKKLRISDNLVRRLKRCDGIFVNGQREFTTKLLEAGDRVEIKVEEAEPECDVVPEDGGDYGFPLEILYEDEGFLVINKPAGVICHPSRARYTGTELNFAAGYLKDKFGDGRCHAVNRLDRDTSGVLLVARNSYMKALLSEALQKDSARKEYIAVVYGGPGSAEGTIDLPIKRLREGDMMRGVAKDGQRAVTRFKVEGRGKLPSIYASCRQMGDSAGECGECSVSRNEDVAVLRLTLETGRTHQIRVHCFHEGYPLLGDVLYYTDASKALSDSLGINAQMLHAEKMVFESPWGDGLLEITAPVNRQDMADVIDAIKENVENAG